MSERHRFLPGRDQALLRTARIVRIISVDLLNCGRALVFLRHGRERLFQIPSDEKPESRGATSAVIHLATASPVRWRTRRIRAALQPDQ